MHSRQVFRFATNLLYRCCFEIIAGTALLYPDSRFSTKAKANADVIAYRVVDESVEGQGRDAVVMWIERIVASISENRRQGVSTIVRRMFYPREPANAGRVFFLILLRVAIIGLKLTAH